MGKPACPRGKVNYYCGIRRYFVDSDVQGRNATVRSERSRRRLAMGSLDSARRNCGVTDVRLSPEKFAAHTIESGCTQKLHRTDPRMFAKAERSVRAGSLPLRQQGRREIAAGRRCSWVNSSTARTCTGRRKSRDSEDGCNCDDGPQSEATPKNAPSLAEPVSARTDPQNSCPVRAITELLVTGTDVPATVRSASRARMLIPAPAERARRFSSSPVIADALIVKARVERTRSFCACADHSTGITYDSPPPDESALSCIPDVQRNRSAAAIVWRAIVCFHFPPRNSSRPGINGDTP